MPPMPRPAPVLATLGLLVLASSPPSGQTSPPRVVAVGDVHGARDAFVAILEQAGLIDARQRWSGGSDTLVQTGDYMDRGRDVRAVMDLLMALESQAKTAG
ncbi:MAG: metallophosphoesterase, partial [Acidobacteriota bacterium]|nr:metallophosphoesterase [Acidobacteriota bacterium]